MSNFDVESHFKLEILWADHPQESILMHKYIFSQVVHYDRYSVVLQIYSFKINCNRFVGHIVQHI